MLRTIVAGIGINASKRSRYLKLDWIGFLRPFRKKSKQKKPGGQEPLDGRLLTLAILLLTLSVIPHFGHIRVEIMLIYLFVAGWSAAGIRWRWLPRNRWIIYLFALFGFSISAWIYGPPIGRDPGVAFLVVLAGLKCLEVTSRREFKTLVLLGLFVVVTHFLYADGVSWAFPLVMVVAGWCWLMTQIERASLERFSFSDATVVGKLFVQALPFLIILFYMFPRLSTSFYLFEANSNTALTGLADTLKMGSISNMIQSDEEAFTATFINGRVPPADQRYWRGNVFWQTDGKEWQRGRTIPRSGKMSRQESQTAIYEYDVVLQPNNQNWLFSLDYPDAAPSGSLLEEDFHIFTTNKITEPFQYSLKSLLDNNDRLLPHARAAALRWNTDLFGERFDDLVAELTKDTSNPLQIAANALEHFRSNDFSYTLQPPLLLSDSPVEEFLFESRRGFCGHYANSFATLMRASGVPARIVVGYLGGELNPRSNQIVVRQADAHAWVEIWIDSQGWLRVDPTGAVAPERVEFGIDYTSSVGSGGTVLFNRRDFDGFRRLLIEIEWLQDAVKATWNRWFIAFDAKRQARLLENLGLGKLDLKTLSIVSFLIAVGLLTAISFLIFRRERRNIPLVERLYQNFCEKLGKFGLHRYTGEGPRDFARRASKQQPQKAALIESITNEFVRLQYASEQRATDQEAQRLRNLIKELG